MRGPVSLFHCGWTSGNSCCALHFRLAVVSVCQPLHARLLAGASERVCVLAPTRGDLGVSVLQGHSEGNIEKRCRGVTVE